MSCSSKVVIGFNGSRAKVQGEAKMAVSIAGRSVSVSVLQTPSILPGVDVIVGLDVIRHHRITIDHGNLTVAAAVRVAAPELKVEGSNFEATFNGSFRTAKWDWHAMNQRGITR